MKWLAICAAVFFTVALVAPLGLMLWGFLVGDSVAVLVGVFQFGLGAIFSFPFVWAISGGDNEKC